MEKETEKETESILEILNKAVQQVVNNERAFFDKKVDTIVNMLEEDSAKLATMYTHKQVISLFNLLKEKK